MIVQVTRAVGAEPAGAAKVAETRRISTPNWNEGQIDKLADGVGFEPTRSRPLPVFKTGAFNRSATHPASLFRAGTV